MQNLQSKKQTHILNENNATRRRRLFINNETWWFNPAWHTIQETFYFVLKVIENKWIFDTKVDKKGDNTIGLNELFWDCENTHWPYFVLLWAKYCVSTDGAILIGVEPRRTLVFQRRFSRNDITSGRIGASRKKAGWLTFLSSLD